MKNTIKNIVLDLGGVLLPIDYSAPVRAFEQLGIQKFNEFYSQAQQSHLFDDFETGKISADEFRNEIRKVSGLHLNDDIIDQAWNSILLRFPPERKRLLEDLSKNYRIFLLSNTNEIHIKQFEEEMITSFGDNFFYSVFEKVYYSSRIGLRKPHREVFDFVLQENQLKPEETLFLDDSIQHIDGARLTGIVALWIDTSTTTTEDVLRKSGLI